MKQIIKPLFSSTTSNYRLKNLFSNAYWFAGLLICFYGLFYFVFKFLGETLAFVCTTTLFDLFVLLWLISRRIYTSTFLVTVFFAAIYGIGIYKRHILNTPFLAHDFYFLVQDLAVNFSTFLQYPKLLLISTLALTGFIGVLIWLYRNEEPAPLPRKVIIASVLLLCVSAEPTVKEYNEKFYSQEVIDKIKLLANDSDYLTKFLSSFIILNHEVNLESYQHTPFKITPVPSTKHRPDIVAILHESSFDLSSLKNCPSDFCNLDLFHSDAHTVQSGFLRVHVTGGSTWLSEFAFLTGLDHHLFGESGLYVPYTIAPRMQNSIAINLKSLGYRTIAINPVGGNFLHAAEAYGHYGFDEIYAAEDLGFQDDWLQIYDRDVYKKAIEKLEDKAKQANKNQPVFIYILTIQNHGPHDTLLESPLAPFVPYNGDSSAKMDLEVYRQRYVQSIRDIKNFETYLLNRKRETVIVRFGDHQPAFDGKIEDLEFNFPSSLQPQNKNYVTRYVIKSNLQKSFSQHKDSPQDLAYLAGDTLRWAGVPLNTYFQSNQTLKKQCKSLFINCPDFNYFQGYLGYIFHSLKVYKSPDSP